MDIISIVLANSYSDSQRLAYEYENIRTKYVWGTCGFTANEETGDLAETMQGKRWVWFFSSSIFLTIKR